MLSARGVYKSYGSTEALRGVDLEIAAGEICGLLGPNGAGKTTLVSIVAGLRRPDAGTVEVDGIDVAEQPDRVRRRLGLAPQELGIYASLTVRDNLRFFGELADLRGQALKARLDEVAAAFELDSFLDRQSGALSGGERRRLHTAVALMHRPPLLLLDEPTTGVDVRTRSNVLSVVRELADDGCAVCYSTHYLAEVETLGASVAIIDHGAIIARGSLGELVRAHGTAALELRFADDGRKPPAIRGYRTDTDGTVVRVYTPDPAVEAATILTGLGRSASRLRSIEIVTPNLEAVFLALTGRRLDRDEEASRASVA